MGGAGLSPIAPGTVGSAWAVGVFFVAVVLGRNADVGAMAMFGVWATAVLGASVLGVWAANRVEGRFGTHDDGRIVIDEVAGQWIALAPVVATGAVLREDLSRVGLQVVTAFVLFRVFDVWKPGAIRWAERRYEGGLGVMADDWLAGIHAAFVLGLVFWLVDARPHVDSLLAVLSVHGGAAVEGSAG